MKVLMINGSCNEQGCTYTALSEVAKVLNNEGIETEIIQLGKSGLSGLHRLRCLPKTEQPLRL